MDYESRTGYLGNNAATKMKETGFRFMGTHKAVCMSRTGAINLRLIFLLVVLCAPVAWLMWVFTSSALSGGVVNRGNYLEVDLKWISSFEMDPDNATDQSVPKQFRDLDGKRVLLIGEMYKPNAANGSISDFDLVYSISKCCVTSSPKIQHFVQSTVVPGKAVGYYNGLVKAIGKLHVGVQKKEGGKVSSVYRFDVESVDPS